MTVYAIVTGARLVVVEALDPEGSHKVESIALVRVMMCDSVSGPSGWMNVLRSTFRPNLKMFLAEGAHFAQIELLGKAVQPSRRRTAPAKIKLLCSMASAV
jgi:hypothetical protein